MTAGSMNGSGRKDISGWIKVLFITLRLVSGMDHTQSMRLKIIGEAPFENNK